MSRHQGGWTNGLQWVYFLQVTCAGPKLPGTLFPEREFTPVPAQVCERKRGAGSGATSALCRAWRGVREEGETCRGAPQEADTAAGLGAGTNLGRGAAQTRPWRRPQPGLALEGPPNPGAGPHLPELRWPLPAPPTLNLSQPCLRPAPSLSLAAWLGVGGALCRVTGCGVQSRSGAVSSAGGEGCLRPRSMRAGRGGAGLRFTLNPRKSPKLEKCSIRHRSIALCRSAPLQRAGGGAAGAPRRGPAGSRGCGREPPPPPPTDSARGPGDPGDVAPLCCLRTSHSAPPQLTRVTDQAPPLPGRRPRVCLRHCSLGGPLREVGI